MNTPMRYRNIEIWGTVISIQSPENFVSVEEFESACDAAQNFYGSINQIFSTYLDGSEVSGLRRQEIAISDASPELKLVWNKC